MAMPISQLFQLACRGVNRHPDNASYEVCEKLVELVVERCIEICREHNSPADGDVGLFIADKIAGEFARVDIVKHKKDTSSYQGDLSPNLLGDSLQKACDAVINHTELYFANMLGLRPIQKMEVINTPDALNLLDITTIISLGGAANVMMAITAESRLALKLTDIETEGLGLTPEEVKQYVPETLAETANIIAGHCTADLELPTMMVTLSTPIIIESRKLVCSTPRVEYKKIRYTTSAGEFDIICISPRESAQINETEKLKFREGGRSV